MQTKALYQPPNFAPFFILGHKLTGIIKEYNLGYDWRGSSTSYAFYIGLTDHNEEGVWKWASSGRKLNETALGSYGHTYGYDNGWAHNEPNGQKREDCVAVVDNGSGNKYNLYDIECTSKLYIICEMSLTNELDVNDLPQ